MAAQPSSKLANSVLPEPLYRALVHVFAQGISGTMLVGGTALAGYYAGHRRSDDLDLFVRDAAAHRATVLAVKSLRGLHAGIAEQQHTSQFYSATVRLNEHHFTVQVVLDAHLFEVAGSMQAPDGVRVADLETLLRMKAATLVSRCSEKDLYDLEWLFGKFPGLDVRRLLELGSAIDAGMNAESALLNVVGTELSVARCGFSSSQSPAEVFADIKSLKARIADALDKAARQQPTPAIGELVRKLGSNGPVSPKREE